MDTLDLDSLLAEPAPLCWDRLHATNGPLEAAAAPAAAGDALDQALPWLVRHLGVADALEAVLAADAAPAGASAATADAHGPEAPGPVAAAQAEAGDAAPRGLLPGALALIGYDARLRPVAPADFATLPLPALLLLRGGDACVLTGLQRRGGATLLQVVMPGRPPLAFSLPPEAVAAAYTGVALLLRRRAEAACLPPPAAADGPLARLAQALAAALATAAGPHPPRAWGGRPVLGTGEPGQTAMGRAWRAACGAAGRWQARFATPRRRLDKALKSGVGRPISG